jgi:hypothetical protein
VGFYQLKLTVIQVDGNVEIQTAPLEVSLQTTDITPNALRILEWICLTFRKPIEHALSSSTINRIGNLSSLGELFPFRESPDNTHTSQCWCQLFDSGVVASDPSIDSRIHCRGLELDFKNLLRISAVEYPVLVESGIILMGYSTALIPIELTKDGKIMWHLEVAKDDFQLQICNIEATKKKWLRDTRLDYLQSQTAVLGWCSDAEVLLGTSRLNLNVTLSDAKSKPISWRWGGANLQLVAQSASPLALGGQLGFTFDRYINTLRFNPSDNYLKCLSNSARQHIVLYDVTAKRAWLVSLLSVLHHMLLVWSDRNHEGFKKASPPTATPGPDCGLASLNALRDQGGLVLDSCGADMTTLRDLIMGFSVNMSKAALHSPKGSKIYGYEFLDIVTESPDSQLKKAKLEKQGLGWISLLNEIKCLFCSNLGDVIIGKRSNLALSPCNILIEGYDLMAVSVHSIKTLSEKYGGKTHGSICRLSQTHFWNLAGSPFRSCQHTHNDGSCWNRPELLGEILQEIKNQPPEHPNPQNGASFTTGALVFGGQARSRTFFLRAQSAETDAVSIRGMVT